MFRMEWLQDKAVEFILKIPSSKLDGTSSIFLEKVTILLYAVLTSSPFCLIFVLLIMDQYFWNKECLMLLVTLTLTVIHILKLDPAVCLHNV